MREPAIIRMLVDGKRVHLHDGPIDLIIEANGGTDAVRAAYHASASRFLTILDELCTELALLRSEWRTGSPMPTGIIAKRMAHAVFPYADGNFITPMAAVAGAVAEEVLLAMTSEAQLTRAYVNNGGDIAIHVSLGESYGIGMVERPDRLSLFGKFRLTHDLPVRGVATSGWRGRSFSLGIADAVTALAKTASMADAAATMIANAVNLPDHPAIVRVAANEIAPDSDLGPRLVTRDVGPLSHTDIASALDSGERVAHDCATRGLIFAAALHLQAETRIVSNANLRMVQASEDSQRSLLHA
jgi:uncharacterized protein